MSELEQWIKTHPECAPIRILEEDLRWAKQEGKKRYAKGREKGWSNRSADPASSEYIGLLGERSVAISYNCAISGITAETKAELNAGDFKNWAEFIEAKSNAKGIDLVVNQDQLKLESAYVNVLIPAEPIQYTYIQGWAWGHEIKTKARTGKGPKGQGVYILDAKHLRPPLTLWEVIFNRPKFKAWSDAEVANNIKRFIPVFER